MSNLSDTNYSENMAIIVDLIDSNTGPMQCAEICESLNMKPNTVRKYLRRASERKLIQRLYRGIYASAE